MLSRLVVPFYGLFPGPIWTVQMAITPFLNFAFLAAVDVVIVELASRPEPLSIR